MYESIAVPAGVDVVMAAPRMIGEGVHRRCVDGRGYPSFVAVERDAMGHAWPRPLAFARAIGATRGGAHLSRPRRQALDHPLTATEDGWRARTGREGR